MDRLIETRELVKEFHGRGLLARRRRASLRAVDRVSFDIRRGEIFGLVGESGCGKTTLSRALLWLDPPTSGEVLFEGAALDGRNRGRLRELRRNAQIVFQDPNGALNPKMRIRDSLQEGLINLGVPAAERRRRVEGLLEQVGLAGGGRVLDAWPHEFSGGQKQRLVVARALSMEPRFLLLDEPVSNLDVSVQAQIINLLLDIKKRLALTYLFISHDLNLVGYLSDRIAVMHRGRIVEMGDAARLLERPVHPYTRRLFASSPSLHGGAVLEEDEEEQEGADTVRAAAGDAVRPANRDKQPPFAERGLFDGCAYADRCPDARPDCREEAAELREIEEGHRVACLYT